MKYNTYNTLFLITFNFALIKIQYIVWVLKYRKYTSKIKNLTRRITYLHTYCAEFVIRINISKIYVYNMSILFYKLEKIKITVIYITKKLSRISQRYSINDYSLKRKSIKQKSIWSHNSICVIIWTDRNYKIDDIGIYFS